MLLARAVTVVILDHLLGCLSHRHAGYRYSGHVMAYAYGQILPQEVSRIFLLGPSHHVYTQQCLLSTAAAYTSPFGSMAIDQGVYRELQSTGMFPAMSLDVDEGEHSLELHLPYIAYVMRGRAFTLVPIMVGALNPSSEERYGELLAPYLSDPHNVFVISSDFCHWGTRFSFTYYNEAQGQIYDSITWLDHKGIETILEGSPEAFQQYMLRFSNTICGRHPVAVLLHMLKYSGLQAKISLRKYDQSSKCIRLSDSSVSYAAIVASFES